MMLNGIQKKFCAPLIEAELRPQEAAHKRRGTRTVIEVGSIIDPAAVMKYGEQASDTQIGAGVRRNEEHRILDPPPVSRAMHGARTTAKAGRGERAPLAEC
jgi:hypothetical protein